MNFIISNYKVGSTLVPSKGATNSMSIREIKINKVINSKKNQPEYRCAIKYKNGKIDIDVKFLEDKITQNFSLKLRDLLSAL